MGALEVKNNRIPQVVAVAKYFATHSLSIGYQGSTGSDAYSNGLTVAANAAIQEFGGGDVGERAFLRTTFEAYREEVVAAFARELGRAFELKQSGAQALANVGKELVALVHRRIESAEQWAEPGGGGGQLLIDTRKLIDSVSWAIRKGGEIVEEGVA